MLDDSTSGDAGLLVGRAGKYVLYAVACLTALLFLYFPASVGETGLDDSWRQSLAILLKTGAQAGTEWIHSYGPLGHFGTVMYDSDLFYAGYVWEILTKVVLVLTLLRLMKPVASAWKQIAILLLLGLFLSWTHPEAHSLILLTSLGLLLTIQPNRLSRWLLLLVPFLFAVFAHIKFVYFAFCVVAICVSEIQYRLRSARTLFTPLVLFALYFFLLWIIAGQSLSNFPEYLRGSLETAGGYVEAMAHPGETNELIVALVMFAFLGGVAVIRFKRISGIAPMIVIFAGLFVSWKHGFVRQESHSILFFSYTLFLSLILFFDPNPAVTESRPLSRSGLLRVGLCVCLILSSFFMVHSRWARYINQTHPIQPYTLLEICYARLNSNWASLCHPVSLKAESEQKKIRAIQKWKLPLTKSTFGAHTMDVFSFEQGVAFLNDLNWKPRPVFQSFHTFTPYLAAVNSKFIESESGPAFVLFKLQTTDARFPTLDDNQAFFNLLKWYSPIASENSYLLLKRIDKAAVSKKRFGARIVIQRKIRFGEEVNINVPGRFHTLSLDIDQSIAGKLRSLLFRPPRLKIRVKTSFRDQKDYRLISSIVRQGVLLNPLLTSTGDFARLYGLRDRGRVVSFSIIADENPGPWFSDEIGMVLRSISRPTSTLIDDSKVQKLASTVDSPW